MAWRIHGKLFKGAFLRSENKFVLIPFKIQFNIHLLSIHLAESILQHHRKVQGFINLNKTLSLTSSDGITPGE